MAIVKAHCSDMDLDPEWLKRLCVGCLGTSTTGHIAVLRDMRRSGIDASTIAEAYVPAAARVFGEQWCEDYSSFASVTIGSSRLHQVLRALAEEWRGPEPLNPATPSVLVVVENGTYHTIGATVLSGILRRLGFAVQLIVGTDPLELEYHLELTDHAVAFVSASGHSNLDTLQAIVEIVHRAKPANKNMARIPVIIGGTIAKDGLKTPHEVLAVTGADYFSDDPAEALALCGLGSSNTAIETLSDRRA